MRKVSPATVSKKINALKEEINELVEKENKKKNKKRVFSLSHL